MNYVVYEIFFKINCFKYILLFAIYITLLHVLNSIYRAEISNRCNHVGHICFQFSINKNKVLHIIVIIL